VRSNLTDKQFEAIDSDEQECECGCHLDMQYPSIMGEVDL